MGKRIMVTGGAGFIGSHTVTALLEAGHTVLVYDNFSSGHRDGLITKAVEICEGDIRDQETLAGAVRQFTPDAILHLAALVSVPLSVQQPDRAHAINLTGTINVLEAARLTEVARVVLASTAAVYGINPRVPARESDPPDPGSPYAVQKLAAEYYARCYQQLYGMETVCLRYFNVYGPGQDPCSPYAGVISRFAHNIMTRQPVYIYGNGERTRDFIDVRDVAHSNVAALILPQASGQTINVGTGKSTSIHALYEIISGLLKGRFALDEPLLLPDRPGDVAHSCADISRLQSMLEYEPQMTTASGLEYLFSTDKGALTLVS